MEDEDERIKENDGSLKEIFMLSVAFLPMLYIGSNTYDYVVEKASAFMEKHDILQDIIHAPREELIFWQIEDVFEQRRLERAEVIKRLLGEEPTCTECNTPIHEP